MKRSYLALPLLVTACQVQMQAQASGTGASAANNTAAPAPVEPVEHTKSKGHGKTWSASFHKSGSVKIDWQGRSGRVCRSVEPFKFVGIARLAGTAQLKNGKGTASGTADASGKVSGGGSAKADCEPPRTTVPPPVAETPPTKVPPKPSTKPEPPPRTKPKPGDIGKAPPVNPSPVKVTKPETPPKPVTPPVVTPPETPPKPASPTPPELENPKPPPAEPPPNVFGYDDPIQGCFEGQVFPLAADTQSLPPSYEALKPISVVYACEWDIAPRSWDTGFPGVAERFEWFAIRYAGSFHLAEAGDYTFRISSDDGTKLSIDNKLVVDNDGQHPPKVATGKVTLAAGDHAMVLEYFQGPRYQINLQVWVTPPGKPEELFTVR